MSYTTHTHFEDNKKQVILFINRFEFRGQVGMGQKERLKQENPLSPTCLSKGQRLSTEFGQILIKYIKFLLEKMFSNTK